MVTVRPIRAFLASAMILLWMIGGSHCEVSAAVGSLVGEAHSHSDGTESCPSNSADCDDCSLCVAMDDGLVPLTSKTVPPEAPVLTLAHFLVPLDELLVSLKPVDPPDSPPEHSCPTSWQFSQRVVLPARAPSFAS